MLDSPPQMDLHMLMNRHTAARSCMRTPGLPDFIKPAADNNAFRVESVSYSLSFSYSNPIPIYGHFNPECITGCRHLQPA